MSTRRPDIGKNVNIEVDDGLQSLGCGAVAEGFGQSVAPCSVFVRKLRLLSPESSDPVVLMIG